MEIKNIDAATAKKWLDNKEAILIDVREPAEYASQNISEATLIPLSQVHLNALPKHDGKKIIIHCHSGKRSAMACYNLLQEDSSLDLYNLEGGILAWAGSGNSTNSSEKKTLPLDRQVQLTVGSLSLFGSILAYFVNPLFVIIPAFIGAGLTFAGLTGTCGLALCLAKCPWNQVSK